MRRILIVSAVLAVLIGVAQLVLGNGWTIALVSVPVAFVVAVAVLWVASRFGRPEP